MTLLMWLGTYLTAFSLKKGFSPLNLAEFRFYLYAFKNAVVFKGFKNT